ncbi:MAG: carboxypeptidase-like regulatory domain-containing protein [Chloroflexota bacterium]
MMKIPLLLLLTGALLGSTACATPATSATPSPAVVPITTPEAAVARVLLAEIRFAGLRPRDPALIGQASWYEVAPASGVGAFVVTVRVGWGDCESGCIDEHRWQYAVAPNGTVSTISETGAAVPGTAWPNPGGTNRTGIGGKATAGPVCPVEKNPPDPACAPRPVAGAVLLVRDASGSEVGKTTTGVDGTFFIDLPPGGYVVEPQPVSGLMGTAGSQSVTVNQGVASTIQIDYDTGIR